MVFEHLNQCARRAALFAGLVVLDPKGAIALHERDLMITTVELMLIVVIPVFVMTAAFAWRYRASNTKAKYLPNWEHNREDEIIWWAVPAVIIAILAWYAWTTSHTLDPYRPIASDKAPITIQVVALDWKWLFIYPAQHIATVNLVQFPQGTPIDFQITADAPMNSFWIPQLGGQIYAMPGMTTHLHLIADGEGEYTGSSANFSGAGFSGMKFTARSMSQEDFDAWALWVGHHRNALNEMAYAALSAPSTDEPIEYYSPVDPSLYTSVISKFMVPATMPMHH